MPLALVMKELNDIRAELRDAQSAQTVAAQTVASRQPVLTGWWKRIRAIWARPVVEEKPDRIKTYRNERNGFEINVPEKWSLPAQGAVRDVKFGCSSNEAFDVQIGSLIRETPLDQTQTRVRRYVQDKGYLALELGRFTVKGKEHIWARYHMGNGRWSKKYMIVLNGVEYAITATCLDQESLWGNGKRLGRDSTIRFALSGYLILTCPKLCRYLLNLRD